MKINQEMLSVTRKGKLPKSLYLKTLENRQQRFLSSLGLLNIFVIYNVVFPLIDKGKNTSILDRNGYVAPLYHYVHSSSLN